MASISFLYLSLKECLFNFNVGPNSPPFMLISFGRMTHFFICAARDTAFVFASSMPFWIAALIDPPFSDSPNISDTLVKVLPTDWHHKMASFVRLSVGKSVSLSISTLKVRKMLRNFCLSPIKIALDIHGR